MTTLDLSQRDLSRRALLRSAMLAVGGGAALGACMMAGAASAGTVKQSQKAASYQPTPHGNAHCNTCTQWLAPNDCKTVVGPVSPTGWCSLYISKW